ncbi:hypothetical protein AAMO2058_000368400 [Amorphochlora amoebiformis]
MLSTSDLKAARDDENSYEALKRRIDRWKDSRRTSTSDDQIQPIDYNRHLAHLRSQQTKMYMSNLRDKIANKVNSPAQSLNASAQPHGVPSRAMAPFIPLVPHSAASLLSQSAGPKVGGGSTSANSSISAAADSTPLFERGGIRNRDISHLRSTNRNPSRTSREPSGFNRGPSRPRDSSQRDSSRPRIRSRYRNPTRAPRIKITSPKPRSGLRSRATNQILGRRTKSSVSHFKQAQSMNSQAKSKRNTPKAVSMYEKKVSRYMEPKFSHVPGGRMSKAGRGADHSPSRPATHRRAINEENFIKSPCITRASSHDTNLLTSHHTAQNAESVAPKTDQKKRAVSQDVKELKAKLDREREERMISQEREQYLRYLLEARLSNGEKEAEKENRSKPNSIIREAREEVQLLHGKLLPMLKEAEDRMKGLADQFFIVPTNPMLKQASKAMGRAIAQNADKLADMLLDDLLVDAANNLNNCEERNTAYLSAQNAEQAMKDALQLAEEYRTDLDQIRNRYLNHESDPKPTPKEVQDRVLKNVCPPPLLEQPLTYRFADRLPSSPILNNTDQPNQPLAPPIFLEDADLLNKKTFNTVSYYHNSEWTQHLEPFPKDKGPAPRAVNRGNGNSRDVKPRDVKPRDAKPRDVRETEGAAKLMWVKEVMDSRDAYGKFKEVGKGSIKERLGISFTEVVELVADDIVDEAVASVSTELDDVLNERVEALVAAEFKL